LGIGSFLDDSRKYRLRRNQSDIYNAFKAADMPGFPKGSYYAEIDESRVIIFTSFVGSLAGAFVYIFNKFRTFDIYPSTYLQASIGFIAGSLGAIFVGSVYPSAPSEFFSFAIGFLTSINVAFLSNLLRRQVANLTGTVLPDDRGGDLNAIIQNANAIESLHNISIYSIADLVKAEPLTVYLSLSTSIGVINGWFDEGLLLYYFGTEKVSVLGSLGLRRFTQLVEIAIEVWPEAGEGLSSIVWRKEIPLLASTQVEYVMRD
jgi:hypothetical protein